jgi:hypothetical protein
MTHTLLHSAFNYKIKQLSIAQRIYERPLKCSEVVECLRETLTTKKYFFKLITKNTFCVNHFLLLMFFCLYN